MRIALDTSVIISVILFPHTPLDQMIKIITEKHTLILSSFVIEELKAVIERKFPGKQAAVSKFLKTFPYEIVDTPKEMEQGLFQIRDEKDYPVLYTAIIGDVDIFISGDKDFIDIDIQKPQILTPAQFLAKYC
jgi:putative PIN family toxin of toxin-antitoxin system